MLGSIGNIVKSAVTKSAEWVGTTIGGKVGGPKGATIGQRIGKAVGGLFEKKPGASEPFSPISTSVSMPSFGGRVSTYKAGEARGPDVRMKTVDGETLNAEWEYRLTKGLRNRNLYT
jgi:phage tail tape-measure protein